MSRYEQVQEFMIRRMQVERGAHVVASDVLEEFNREQVAAGLVPWPARVFMLRARPAMASVDGDVRFSQGRVTTTRRSTPRGYAGEIGRNVRVRAWWGIGFRPL